MIFAAFSAIIMVGAFVLPDVMSGMIDASTTLKPAKPCTLRFWSTTEYLSSPILQVPQGWYAVIAVSFAHSTSSLSPTPSEKGAS